jgi:hypothetical protein
MNIPEEIEKARQLLLASQRETDRNKCLQFANQAASALCMVRLEVERLTRNEIEPIETEIAAVHAQVRMMVHAKADA